MIHRRTVVAATLMLASAACLDLSAPGSGVLSLAPLRLPYPAVVAGDTLRDASGTPARIRVIALDPRGDTIAEPPVTFLVSSTSAVSITEDGYLVGLQVTEDPVRVVAQTAGLQIETRVDVVRRPTDVVRTSPEELAPVTYAPGSGQTALLRSADLAVRVESATESPTAPVRSWLVHYEITRMPAAAPGAPLPPAFLGTETDAPSVVDTTSTSGAAARRVLVRQALLAGVASDTIEVRARVTERGVEIAGSPVIFRIPIATQ